MVEGGRVIGKNVIFVFLFVYRFGRWDGFFFGVWWRCVWIFRWVGKGRK